jgi:hypothetical protein
MMTVTLDNGDDTDDNVTYQNTYSILLHSASISHDVQSHITIKTAFIKEAIIRA